MFKKILFGMSALALATACTDDYTDWAKPQTNPAVPAKTIEYAIAAAQTEAFVLDDITDETVQVINVTLPAGVTAESYNVNLTAEGANYPDYNVTADADGFVKVADLQKAATGMFTLEAIEREFTAVASATVSVPGQTGTAAVQIASDPFTITIKPTTPEFEPFIYFIGATDGWATPDQKLASPSRNGLYTGYCYVADPNGWGLAFKFQRVQGSWDDEINAGTFTTKTGVTGDNNIEVAEEGVYYMEVNLAASTITATKVTAMGLIGDFNGWGGDVEMTWNATDFCYEATEAPVTAAGWKFRMNNDWAINLGGTLDNLVGNGDNLSAVGTTIKLYPTRKTSDNIYCTVE